MPSDHDSVMGLQQLIESDGKQSSENKRGGQGEKQKEEAIDQKC